MRKAWLLFSQTVTIAVALLFVVATLKPAWLKRAPEPVASVAPAAPAVQLPAPVRSVSLIGTGAATSYAEAAKRASPAVVSITASRTARQVDPAFGLFFGRQREPQARQVGLGSGVIVSPSGYLLTNN